MRNIETAANAELSRWKAEIDEQLSPRAKIALIDSIDRQRTLQAGSREAAAGAVEGEGDLSVSAPSANVSGSPQAKASSDSGGVSGVSSVLNGPALRPAGGNGAAVSQLDQLVQLGARPNTSHAGTALSTGSPTGKKAQGQGQGQEQEQGQEQGQGQGNNDGGDGEDESAPVSPTGGLPAPAAALSGGQYLLPMSAQEAEQAVQAELMQFQREKQLEIDLSIREQRRYLQVVVQQQRMEEKEMEARKKREEEERVTREVELAMQRKAAEEKEAQRAMEAEWSRLQAAMARDRAAKLQWLRHEQEMAEARLGVKVKGSGALVKASFTSGNGKNGSQSGKKIGKKPSKIPKKAPTAASSPAKRLPLPLGSAVTLHSSSQQELAYARQMSKSASGTNVSVLAGMGMGAGAGAAIFASLLS